MSRCVRPVAGKFWIRRSGGSELHPPRSPHPPRGAAGRLKRSGVPRPSRLSDRPRPEERACRGARIAIPRVVCGGREILSDARSTWTGTTSPTTRSGPRSGTSILPSCAACTASGPSRAAQRVSSETGSAKKRSRRGRTRTWSAGSSTPADAREPSCRPRRRSNGSAPDALVEAERRIGASRPARASARPRASARRNGRRRRDAIRLAQAVRAGRQFRRRQPVAGPPRAPPAPRCSGKPLPRDPSASDQAAAPAGGSATSPTGSASPPTTAASRFSRSAPSSGSCSSSTRWWRRHGPLTTGWSAPKTPTEITCDKPS